MADIQSSSPDVPPPKRFQFGFWTLAEVVAGIGLVCALLAELREHSPLVIGPAVFVLSVAWMLARRRQRQSWIFELLTLLAISLVLTAFGLPLVQSPRYADRMLFCRSNLKNIGLALHAYHDDYGQFPPAVVKGPDGSPWHSWRTLILPYLERRDRYDAYDFSQPWNGFNNVVFVRSPEFFCTCLHETRKTAWSTNYHYVVGAGREQVASGLKLSELEAADGAANTVLVVEAHDLEVEWFEPRDLDMDRAVSAVNGPSQPNISSRHAIHTIRGRFPGAHALTADGEVHFITNNADRDMLKAVLTIDGGEGVDWSKLTVVPDRRFAIAWVIFCTIAYVGFIIWRHWPR